MKKKPTKLEAKVAELEKKLAALLSFNIQQNLTEMQRRIAFVENDLKTIDKPKEPQTFEDCKDLVPVMSTFDVTIPSKRASQLKAIAKMMTVADALDMNDNRQVWAIFKDDNHEIYVDSYSEGYSLAGGITFQSKRRALKAIEILGEETIKIAFGL